MKAVRTNDGAGNRRRSRGRGRFAGLLSTLSAGGLLLGVLGLVPGCAATSHKSTSKAATTPHRGGSMTVLEGSSFAGAWPGLDPSTDTAGAANQPYMDAIYGQLFDLSAGGKMVGDLATGYKYSNGGKTITILLRKGVKFSDGTPFNSAAVKFNWVRDLATSCSCKPVFTQKATPVIATAGPYAVSITLQYVDASFINGLQSDIFSWIASPHSLAKMGEQAFALKPVGAGPFLVVSDTPSSSLVLKRNPHYFNQPLPYLNTLVFKSVANDEAAYEAMLAGSAQAYEGMSTPQLAKAFRGHFQLTAEPSTSPYDIQVNTSIPPFNNLKARQAIYYAINCQLLDQKLFNNNTLCGQSFEAPAGLFYEKKVPGYLGYNLAKAKALVNQLGGLSMNFFTITSPVALTLMEALQTEFQAAGMKVNIAQYDLGALIGQFLGGKWQIALQTAGAFDPATGVGVGFRFASTSPFSGVHSPRLDALLSAASATTDAHKRQTLYNAAGKYISDNADGPFLFPINGYDAVVHGAGGPGLSTPLPSVVVNVEVLWQYAYNNKQ